MKKKTEDKDQLTEVKNVLENEFKTAWTSYSQDEEKACFAFSDDYMDFLNHSKTERLCAAHTVNLAEKAGFKPLETYQKKGTLKAGDKVYIYYRKKAVMLVVVGKTPLEKGMRIIGAHIDAPRLDIKPSPLYEKSDMAYLKTHYYGGIKKYQWVTIPLALHGTVAKKDGTSIDISIGDKENEPVLYISDLLPHLSKEQNVKRMTEGIKGEGLNLLVGSIPYRDEDLTDSVKLGVLNLLNQKYKMTEADFASAELEAVPAGPARHVGLDESFVGAYGQDDRICAYTGLRAILDFDGTPEHTICTLLADKEEIGSYGNTGMQSNFFENQMAEIIALADNTKGELSLRRCLANSELLSADVTAGYDPNFTGTHDLNNAPMMGKGLVVAKYGGSRGKSGSNDAHAEFLGKLRRCFDESEIVWQMGELGRVDLGGGGTIAYMLAKYGMDVVDCGPALLSMHSPFELSSKADIFETYKGYKAFLSL